MLVHSFRFAPGGLLIRRERFGNGTRLTVNEPIPMLFFSSKQIFYIRFTYFHFWKIREEEEGKENGDRR